MNIWRNFVQKLIKNWRWKYSILMYIILIFYKQMCIRETMYHSVYRSIALFNDISIDGYHLSSYVREVTHILQWLFITYKDVRMLRNSYAQLVTLLVTIIKNRDDWFLNQFNKAINEKNDDLQICHTAL